MSRENERYVRQHHPDRREIHIVRWANRFETENGDVWTGFTICGHLFNAGPGTGIEWMKSYLVDDPICPTCIDWVK